MNTQKTRSILVVGGSVGFADARSAWFDCNQDAEATWTEIDNSFPGGWHITESEGFDGTNLAGATIEKIYELIAWMDKTKTY